MHGGKKTNNKVIVIYITGKALGVDFSSIYKLFLTHHIILYTYIYTVYITDYYSVQFPSSHQW